MSLIFSYVQYIKYIFKRDEKSIVIEIRNWMNSLAFHQPVRISLNTSTAHFNWAEREPCIVVFCVSYTTFCPYSSNRASINQGKYKAQFYKHIPSFAIGFQDTLPWHTMEGIWYIARINYFCAELAWWHILLNIRMKNRISCSCSALTLPIHH